MQVPKKFWNLEFCNWTRPKFLASYSFGFFGERTMSLVVRKKKKKRPLDVDQMVYIRQSKALCQHPFHFVPTQVVASISSPLSSHWTLLPNPSHIRHLVTSFQKYLMSPPLPHWPIYFLGSYCLHYPQLLYTYRTNRFVPSKFTTCTKWLKVYFYDVQQTQKENKCFSSLEEY